MGGIIIKGYKFIVIITTFLIVLCGIVIFNFNSTPSTATTNEDKDSTDVVEVELNENSIKDQPTLGDEEVSVQIVEFGDFICPACQTWNETVFPMIEEDYIKSGKAKFSFVNVLYHDDSELASLAAEVVHKRDPSSYWKFHDNLFRHIKKEREIDQEGIEELIKKHTDIAIEDLNEDMKKPEFARELELDKKLIKEHGVSPTPSLMINGTLLENPFDYEEIEKAINGHGEGT
ncbi:thioredoxin domain-containing protein [Rossellomorea aquimaris]|nr:thioredoxin domain-containing protein [Rossellomorea aquimaris]